MPGPIGENIPLGLAHLDIVMPMPPPPAIPSGCMRTYGPTSDSCIPLAEHGGEVAKGSDRVGRVEAKEQKAANRLWSVL